MTANTKSKLLLNNCELRDSISPPISSVLNPHSAHFNLLKFLGVEKSLDDKLFVYKTQGYC